MRILIDCTRAVSRAWAGTGSPRIGKEQVPLGVEVEIRAFEQLVTVGVSQGADLFFGLRVVDQNVAAVPRREVEFAVVPPRTCGSQA